MGDSLFEHISIFLAGSTALSLLAHAVNTFPTPTNKYGSWFLGVIQWFVGQRVAAKNTLQGKDTMAMGVVKGTGPGTMIYDESSKPGGITIENQPSGR